MKRGGRRARPKDLFDVGSMAKTAYFVPGHPVGIPTGSWVDVVEKVRLSGGTRYRVKTASGGLYWVDADALEPLGT